MNRTLHRALLRGLVLGVGFFAFLVLPPSAAAGHIRLQISIGAVQMAGNTGVVSVQIANEGDETAQSLMLNAVLPDGFKMEPLGPYPLSPKQSLKLTAPVSYGGSDTGSFAGTLRVQYADSNGYPFSATAQFFLHKGRPTTTSVLVQAEPAVLAQGSKTKVICELVNRSEKTQDVRLKVVLPLELVSEISEKQLTLAPQSLHETLFVIRDLGALPGSSYALSLIGDYTEDGRRFAFASNALVQIQPRRSSYLWGIIFVALVLAIWLFSRSLRRRIHPRK